MIKNPDNSIYDKYKIFVEQYKTFDWDTNINDHRPDTRNKNSLLINFIRFYKIISWINTLNTDLNYVIDVGPYPGTMLPLLKEFINPNIHYTGIGLSFTKEYINIMNKLNAELITTELDPEFVLSEKCSEWSINNYDLCLFLDVIEHLTNPVHCLDQINKSLKNGGLVLITTDNIAAFSNSFRMFFKGESPNLHPMQSSVFYKGPWRPHHKEFSYTELLFYLNYSGFEIIRHEYFERKQGDYYINKNNLIFEKSRYTGIKGLIHKVTVNILKHLKDHHIILARKHVDYTTQSKNRPKETTSVDKWLQLRKEYGVD